MTTIQVPSIVLPQVWTLGTETETIADILEHTSIDIPVEYLQEKQIHITATEVAGLRATGVIVGAFIVGEAVVGVPSGAVGVVRAQGANWIEIIYVTGVFIAGDTIIGATSGAIINGALALAVSVPGNLWCWVELSPYPSTVTTAYWAAIGGGGLSLPPTTPLIEVSGLAGAAGVLVHTIILPWAIHSAWARLVIQTPVAAALPNAWWLVQCIISAGSK